MKNVVIPTDEIFILNQIKVLLTSLSLTSTSISSSSSTTTTKQGDGSSNEREMETTIILSMTEPILFFVEKLLTFLNSTTKSISMNSSKKYKNLIISCQFYLKIIESLKNLFNFSKDIVKVLANKLIIDEEKLIETNLTFKMTVTEFIGFLHEIGFDELNLLKMLRSDMTDYRLLKRNIIERVITKEDELKQETIEFIVENEIEFLFEEFFEFLGKLISKQTFSMIVFGKLKDFYLCSRTNVSYLTSLLQNYYHLSNCIF